MNRFLTLAAVAAFAAALATGSLVGKAGFIRQDSGPVVTLPSNMPSENSNEHSTAPHSGGTYESTAGQYSGVVLVNTTIDWGSSKAAGTGLVISADGTVVTNHHVVAGSTSVTVTDPSNGQIYRADVVGYDSAEDVAVLKLEGATNLPTITADTTLPSIGASVTAVGNAEGEGQLVTTTGHVMATGTTVTVTEDDGSKATLTDLIQVSAALVPGDSGGATIDAANHVVAMNVAGSANERVAISYVIPMATVMSVADDILAGRESSTITLGHSAGLGIVVSPYGQIVGVIPGGPADQAGLTVGSTITALAGKAITSADDISAALTSHAPGDQVNMTWTGLDGRPHKAQVTLGVAPLA